MMRQEQRMPPYETDELAEESATPAPRSRGLVLWLFVLSLFVLTLTTFLIASVIREGREPLLAELDELATSAAVTPTTSPEEDTLRTTLIQVMEQAAVIEPIYAQRSANQRNWTEMIGTIAGYNAAEVVLVEVLQQENAIMLRGYAIDEAAASRYAQVLRGSGHFARVVMQSLAFIAPPTPFPADANIPDIPMLSAPERAAAELQTTAGLADFTIVLELEAAPQPTPTTQP